MNKSLCNVKDCRNYGKYARYCGHHPASVSQPKPIAKQSKGLATTLRKEYAPKRAAYLKEHPFCEAQINREESKCKKRAVEIHHMKGRVGELLTDENYFLAVCRTCHRFITENHLIALSEGLSLSRLTA